MKTKKIIEFSLGKTGKSSTVVTCFSMMTFTFYCSCVETLLLEYWETNSRTRQSKKSLSTITKA